MILLRTRFLLSAGLVAAVSTSAFGWNATGHMIVADIAWRNMSPLAQRDAAKILGVSMADAKRVFIESACWADDTKTRETGPWHYIDLYFTRDGRPTDLTPDPQNVVWAIRKFTAVLQAGTAGEAKTDALKYVEHFVGDIHQPLHCASLVSSEHPRGDKGGNDYSIESNATALKLGHRRPYELHYLWDDGAGLFVGERRPLSEQSLAAIDQLATAAEGTVPASSIATALKITNPESWAEEGQSLAKTFVYSTPEHHTPSAAYIRQARTIALKQVDIAGHRLALLLNRLLK